LFLYFFSNTIPFILRITLGSLIAFDLTTIVF